MLSMGAADGGTYKAVIDMSGDYSRLVTFYKEK